MDLGISGRTALVHGAGGGLGRAIALAFAQEGVKVAVADIHVDNANETAAQIRAAGGAAEVFGWDLADLGIVDCRFREIEAKLGPVDILLNNTGGPSATAAAGQSLESWSDYFRSMVLSVLAITDRALPQMRRRGWGRIITSTSSGVIAPIPNLAISNALRLSLVGWSKTLAGEVASLGITANIIVPGRIATKHTRFLDEQAAEHRGQPLPDIEAEVLRMIPSGRYGEPREYADVAAFLGSARASYITGSILRVDGGLVQSI
jgi:3-oxoacyl-[acyl-carrier protein] reductase